VVTLKKSRKLMFIMAVPTAAVVFGVGVGFAGAGAPSGTKAADEAAMEQNQQALASQVPPAPKADTGEVQAHCPLKAASYIPVPFNGGPFTQGQAMINQIDVTAPGGGIETVYAGALPDNSQQGVVTTWTLPGGDPCAPGAAYDGVVAQVLDPDQDGALSIVGATGDSVQVVAADGVASVYNVATNIITPLHP